MATINPKAVLKNKIGFVGAFAYNNVVQACGNGGTVIVDFNITERSAGIDITQSGVGKRFTFTESGVYALDFLTTFPTASGSATAYCALTRNGTTENVRGANCDTLTSPSGLRSINFSTKFTVLKGDYIEIFLSHTTGATRSFGSDTEPRRQTCVDVVKLSELTG